MSCPPAQHARWLHEGQTQGASAKDSPLPKTRGRPLPSAIQQKVAYTVRSGLSKTQIKHHGDNHPFIFRGKIKKSSAGGAVWPVFQGMHKRSTGRDGRKGPIQQIWTKSVVEEEMMCFGKGTRSEPGLLLLLPQGNLRERVVSVPPGTDSYFSGYWDSAELQTRSTKYCKRLCAS